MRYQDAIAEGIKQKFYSEAENLETLRYFENRYKNMVDGDYKIDKGKVSEISYDDLFFQTNKQHHSGDKEVAYLVGLFHYFLSEDLAHIIAIDIKETPYADKNIKSNKRALNRVEKYGFSTETWFGCADFDGIVLLDEAKYPHNDVFKRSGKVRLEVGTTSPFTLGLHLAQSGSFARWPYDSRFLYIYSLTDTFSNTKKEIDF